MIDESQSISLLFCIFCTQIFTVCLGLFNLCWSQAGLSILWDISRHDISSHCDPLCGDNILYPAKDWIGLYGKAVSKLMTDSMILFQTNNLLELMTCFVLDRTPTVHGAMLICDSGTCDWL